jgi:predicted nucleotidyltransferase
MLYDAAMHFLSDLKPANEAAVIFECVAGSRAYGTVTDTSDEDVRGIFVVPSRDYLSLVRPADQLSDERGNIVYYSLRRVVELLSNANPNILELVFMPEDCVRKCAPAMQMLIAERQIFITKQCADTHAGYAMSQIKKARGQNKWVNNPKPEAPPGREDYCYVIPWRSPPATAGMPARPVPLRRSGWNLAEYHAARLEHARDMYRLYHYGPAARGVFRGDMLACESISESDEVARFAGFLIYNESGWKQAMADHQNYWTWRRERNDARWQQQERGELDFDAKNMMHTIRLLLSARSLMQHHRPIVRFEGEDLSLLMTIRQGRLSFDEILLRAESILADCERLKQTAALPEICDTRQASALLSNVTEAWERNHS